MGVLEQTYEEVCKRVKLEMDYLAKASSLAVAGVTQIDAENGASAEFKKISELVYSLKRQFGDEYIGFVAKRSKELSDSFSEGKGHYRDAIVFNALIAIKRNGMII